MMSSSSRALARAHTLMKLLPPRVAAPFSVRSVGSKNDSDSVSGSKSDCNESKVDFHPKQCPNGEVCPLVNRFMKEGSSIPYKVTIDNGAMYARLDMPGIGKKGLKLWVEDNSLHVNGEEEEEEGEKGSPEECRRKYYGNIDIRRSCYKVEEISSKLKNGVLKVKIPKDIINVEVNGPFGSKIQLIHVLPWLFINLLIWRDSLG